MYTQEGHPACKKNEWWGTDVVICLQRGADFHVAQLMPLPLTVSCFSKFQTGFTFLVAAHPGSPRQRAVKRVSVCVCVCVCACVHMLWISFLQAGCPSCHPTNSVKALKDAILSKTSSGKKVKVKFSHTRYQTLGPVIPVYRQSARRWREVNHAIYLAVVCHCFLPGLRLPP